MKVKPWTAGRSLPPGLDPMDPKAVEKWLDEVIWCGVAGGGGNDPGVWQGSDQSLLLGDPGGKA